MSNSPLDESWRKATTKSKFSIFAMSLVSALNNLSNHLLSKQLEKAKPKQRREKEKKKKFPTNSKSRSFTQSFFHFHFHAAAGPDAKVRRQVKVSTFLFRYTSDTASLRSVPPSPRSALLIPFVHLFLFYVLRSFRSANKLWRNERGKRQSRRRAREGKK